MKIVIVIIVSWWAFTLYAQEGFETFDLQRIQQATVFLMQARSSGDNLIPTCVGSGTLVSRSGLILTNAHNIVQSDFCPGDVIIVAMSANPDEPPVPKYRGQIVQVTPGIDLALLSINQQLDGRLIEADSLALPFVDLVDSSQVQLDETITVVGYSGVGSEPVSVVRGTVSAFLVEPVGGDKSWIKTEAVIPGTMSGGGAYNLAGNLIGVPTTAPVSTGANCRSIEDTNNDGIVNNADSCIPIGDFINSLRPANFARPLIQSASLGLIVTPSITVNSVRDTGQQPTIGRLFFSSSLMEDAPTTVVDSLPAGSNSLYLFFDYENMSHNNIFELRVTIDGLPNQTFSLAPVQWSGGRNGLWYIGTSGQPLPNGKVYEFRLFIDGIVAGNRRLVVGGAAEPRPTLSSIAFGLLDLQGNILGNGYVLPTGNIATARFIYQNMVDGLEWTAIWYFNNAEVYRNADVWSDSESGTKDISIQDSNGLLPGNYRLELYLEDRLAATSDFSIAGAQLGALPQVFSNLYFTSAASVEDALIVSPIGNFPNRVDTLYVVFDWQQLTSGTLWTMRWSVDGQVFFEQTQPWDGPVSGEQFLTTLTGTRGIPDGNYQVDLLLKNRMLASATAEVGIGQLPIDRFAQAGGIQMIGRVVDSETGAGIPGIAFVLLSEDFSIEDFTWQQDQIFALSVTDSAGRFQVDRPLQPEVPYSVVVAADGYLPITQDGVLITGTEDNPLELTIYLTRD